LTSCSLSGPLRLTAGFARGFHPDHLAAFDLFGAGHGGSQVVETTIIHVRPPYGCVVRLDDAQRITEAVRYGLGRHGTNRTQAVRGEASEKRSFGLRCAGSTVKLRGSGTVCWRRGDEMLGNNIWRVAGSAPMAQFDA